MEFITAVTGSSFTMKNWQSNFVVRQNGKCLLRLYHYQDNVIDAWDEWNEKAITDGFRGFLKTGARFTRTYDSQEGGLIGNVIYRNAKK